MLFRDDDEDLEMLPFADRSTAGRMLASRLADYSQRKDTIVLGLPRGGVAVASAVADVLHLPLDVLVVSKLGTPWQPELAMGALAEGNVQVIDLSIMQQLCIRDEEMRGVAEMAREDVKMRARFYRRWHSAPKLAGNTTILVDDGIATGCSMLAAAEAVRRRGAARVVVAVPVLASSGCSAIWMEADEVVSVIEAETFLAISQWYQNFDQLTDEDVLQLLETAANIIPGAA